MSKFNEKKQEGKEFVIFNLLKSNKKLKALDVLLYQQIVFTSAFNGYSSKTNKYFIEFFNDTEWNIRKSIEILIEEGLITRTLISNSDRKLYPVKLDFLSFNDDEPLCETQGGMSVTQGGMSVPQGGMSVPQGGMSVPQGGMSVPHTYNNINIQLDNNNINKNNNYNNINIIENFDFVEGDNKSGNNIIPTNTPEGGDNIVPGNDDGVDVSSLLKEVIEIPIEEKLKLSSTKKEKINESSTNEEGYRDISTKFTDDEQSDALNY